MKRILCIGDSNTVGYDPRSYVGARYPADVRWTGILKSAGWQILNGGQNGVTIPRPYEYSMAKNLILSRLPLDGITVMLGTNDLLKGSTAEAAAGRMEQFLSCVKEAAGDACIILISPPALQWGDWVQSREVLAESAGLAARYREAAGRAGVLFADAECWQVGLTFDGVHFSPGGHAAFAEGLRKVLAEALPDDAKENEVEII